MSKNIDQVYIANPITSNASTDLMYFGQSPYAAGNDAAMTYGNFSAQFALSALTSAYIYVGNGSNIATGVAMSGDASISNTGAVTVSNIGNISEGTLSLAHGGTNDAMIADAGAVVYSTSLALALTSVGTSGQLFQSAGIGEPGWTTSTYPSTNAINTILYASSANTMAALATGNNGVLITSNTGVPSWLADSGTPGYVLTANTGAPPSWQSITAEGAVTTIDGDSGSAAPSSGVVTISGGTTGLTTSGTSATLSLTGTLKLGNGGTNANLTANNGGIFYSTSTAGAILAGTATAQQLLMSGASTTPQWSTTTYPTTNAINTLLYASAANVMSALPTVTTAVLTTAAGVPTWASELSLALGGTNANLTASNGGIFYSTASAGAILAGTATAGQSLVSGASTTPQWTTTTYPLTNAINTIMYASSANVLGVITPANNSILTSNGSGVPSWTTSIPSGIAPYTTVDQASSSVTMAVNTQYITDNGASLVTYTLPATAAQGSIFRVFGSSSGGWKIGQAAGQTCHVGSSATTAGTGGSIASTNQWDNIELICTTANTTFVAHGVQGNLTIV